MFGNEAFQFSIHTVFESRVMEGGLSADLPKLRSLRIGENALIGTISEHCRLDMKGRGYPDGSE